MYSFCTVQLSLQNYNVHSHSLQTVLKKKKNRINFNAFMQYSCVRVCRCGCVCVRVKLILTNNEDQKTMTMMLKLLLLS